MKNHNYFSKKKKKSFLLKILNITTQGGKIISTGAGRNPNVVTVNPKTLQLHAVKTPGSKHGKKLYLFLSSF
jgi:hypothetical protein